MRQSGFRLGLLTTVVCIAVLGAVAPAWAERSTHPVTGWVEHAMARLESVDPAGSLSDLAPLRDSIRGARVVGLGESIHGAAEELRLKHRVLRVLVEQLGFRSIAWEEQWTTGFAVNEYIGGGAMELGAVLRQLSPQWQTREVADVLQWLRGFNAGRADKVRFVGVEYYFTGLLAYQAVDAYVAGAAPTRLAELRAHMQEIEPKTDNIYQHVEAYQAITDKRPYINHARRVYDLVAGLPRRPGNQAHALAGQHARQIVSFYEHFSLSDADALVYRDAHAAENLRWWRDYSGDKVAYWAASPHTANAPRLLMTGPSAADMRFPSAGSYLRQWYGQRYVSIGFTFDHGTISTGPGQTIAQPAPAPSWFERPLGNARADQFTVDLRQPAPPAVRSWLRAPITTRGLLIQGPGSIMTGGSLAQWFDLIVHRQQVTPAQSA
jgi:erythromycin esterase-like protein